VTFTSLRTARLTLRPLAPGDAELMFALNGDPEVMRYLPDGAFASVDAARSFLEGYQDVYRTDGFARWAAVEEATGACIGWCGLRRLASGEVDVGYRLVRAAWGRGLATEGARASLDYGFSVLRLERIVARAETANGASVRVLEKIGLRFEGTEEDGAKPLARYGLSLGEWSSSHAVR
jgi:RimJ/RimL family protein N-acetyltransferase